MLIDLNGSLQFLFSSSIAPNKKRTVTYLAAIVNPAVFDTIIAD